MPIKLLALPKSEWRLYYDIAAKAFVPGIMELLYPNGFTERALQHALAELKRSDERHPERFHMFQAIDTELPEDDPLGKTVGISLWQVHPRDKTEEEAQQEKEQGDKDEQRYGRTPDLDQKPREGFGAAIREIKEKVIGRSAHVVLQLLATRPGYERRGIGSTHMAWGTAKADELGLQAWLEASPKGVSLYKRWGFEVAGTMNFDARDYGYYDALTHLCMRRPSVKERAAATQQV